MLDFQMKRAHDLGMLQSEMHMAWVSGLWPFKIRLSLFKDIAYNNFPWPDLVSKSQRKEVEMSAQKIIEIEHNFLKPHLPTYMRSNTMPKILLDAPRFR